MTCTTHHICDCKKERMKKLEKIAYCAREYANANIKYSLNRISEAELAGRYNALIAALELIGGGE